MATAIAIILAVAIIALAITYYRERLQLKNQIQRTEATKNRQLAKVKNYSQKLQSLSETSGASVIMVDENGIIVHANSTAQSMFDVGGESLRGKSLIQATLSSDILTLAKETAKSNQEKSLDVSLPGGNSRILKVSAFPFDVGLSGEKEIMIVIVDVTGIRKLETIRRDFVANVSHELRTPLASIRAIAETLHGGAMHDHEVAPQFLETIISEVDRLSRISEDLLVLSDAESNAPIKEKFNVSSLIQKVVQRLESKSKEAAIRINVQAPSDIYVIANYDQIDQVLVNLIDNAIKYTAKNGSVTIKAEAGELETTISVSDSGIGIMAEDLSRIFERFYRVDKARSRASGGTGLGLSIVKNIIEAHGGDVRVASEYNHGTTFTITIPGSSLELDPT